MSVRDFIDDLKAYPATMGFCISWVVVFVAMVIFQMNGGSPFPWNSSKLMIGMNDGNQFGDLTIRDFRQGEVWRLITCNFVHYGLIHIGLNLLAMYQLGAIVEEWYGSFQMAFIYVMTGGLGNLVSIAARMMMGQQQNVHSGGGSVVIMGLVGLCAVVGWRSHTKRGEYLGQQMINVMILTAMLGLGFPLLVRGVGVDNWGHTGGALIGAILGLGHSRLIRNARRPRGYELGILSLILMIGCGIVQAANERGRMESRNEEIIRARIQLAEQTFQLVRTIKPLIVRPEQAPMIVNILRRLEVEFERPEISGPYRRMIALAEKAQKEPITPQEIADFQTSATELERFTKKEYQTALNEYWQIRKRRDQTIPTGR